MPGAKRLVETTVLVVADVATLLLCRPDVARLTADIRDPYTWAGRAGADSAALDLARLGLWLAAAWLAIGLAAAIASTAPGRLGAAAAALAHRTMPAVLRRVIAGSLGVGIILGPLDAGATPPSHGPGTNVSASVGTSINYAAASGPDVDWPAESKDTPPLDIPWPATPTPIRPPAPSTPQPDHSEKVTVRPDDSLWLIAVRRLGPSATQAQIAAAWPSLYRANTSVIGSDPSLLHPGQVLTFPDSKGSPT